MKKGLHRGYIVVTERTWQHLLHWAAAAGYTEKNVGRVVDKIVREKAMRESVTARHFELERRPRPERGRDEE